MTVLPVCVSSGAVAVLCRLDCGSEPKRLPATAEATGLYKRTAGIRPRYETAQQKPPRSPAVPQEETRLHL